MKKNILQNRGISILGFLVFGFILILVLSYFNVSIRGVVESPTGQENINYVQDTSKGFWDRYLRDPINYFWNEIFIKLIWNSFVSNLERIRDGQPTDFQNYAPQVQIDASSNLINLDN